MRGIMPLVPRRRPTRTTHKTFCRFCHAICGIEVDLEDGRPVAVRGDRDDPMSRGYMCVKGRQLIEQHAHPERLRGSRKRMPDGTFAPISSERAMDEIADALERIIERDGPQAVALYAGTHGLFSAAAPLLIAWIRAIGSPWYFTPNTIDQPAQHIAWARHGSWDAGVHRFSTADVMLFVGNNPGVSCWSQDGGPPYADGFRYLRDAQRRGMKIIAVDPRRSELASRADVHLQVRPGEDPTLLAGMVRVILEEELFDREFAAAHVEGVETLRAAVAGFTPDYVEARTGVPAELMARGARLFARGPRGAALASTGVNMAPRPDVTTHLVCALNSLCGRFNRAGDLAPNPGVLNPLRPRRAEVIPPREIWGKGHRSRFRGLGEFMGEMPINVFADEVLTPGPGQIRAFICVGGNPVVAFPDQRRVIEAMRALELAVALDVKLTATARLSHYAIGCKLSLEKPGAVAPLQVDAPFAHYTPALVEPDFDVIEEWEFFWGLAHRMRTPLRTPASARFWGPGAGLELDLDRKPSSEEYLDLLCRSGRVPLDEVRRHPSGAFFPTEEPQRVLPGRPEAAAHRMNVAPQAVIEQLGEIRAEPFGGAGYRGDRRFSHRLVSRRMLEIYNSTGDHLPGLRRRYPYNPAFMHPESMREIGVRRGDVVRIESEHDFIYGVVEPSDEVLRDVISMAHARGDLPERADGAVRELGSTTNRLVTTQRDFEPISGIPRQSAIPVNVRRCDKPLEER
jgi:anaerobic selenocysteine-containing dehydrogenase